MAMLLVDPDLIFPEVYCSSMVMGDDVGCTSFDRDWRET